MRLRGLATMSAIALAAASFVVACGAFGTDPGAVPALGEDASAADDGTFPEGSAPDAFVVADGGGTDARCHVLLEESFSPPGAPGFTDTAGNTGSVTLDSTLSTSPPSSLLAEGSVAKGTPLNATKQRDIPLGGGLAAGPLELDFDVYLEQTADVYEEIGCTFELRDGTGAQTRLIFARTTGGALVLTAPALDGGTQTVALGSFATLGWHHVHGYVVLVDPSHVAVKYAVAPDSLPAQADAVPAPVSAAVDRVRVVCGIDYANTTSVMDVPVTVFVDSVRLQQCAP